MKLIFAISDGWTESSCTPIHRRAPCLGMVSGVGMNTTISITSVTPNIT